MNMVVSFHNPIDVAMTKLALRRTPTQYTTNGLRLGLREPLSAPRIAPGASPSYMGPNPSRFGSQPVGNGTATFGSLSPVVVISDCEGSRLNGDTVSLSNR
jgi:hypothetical protein